MKILDVQLFEQVVTDTQSALKEKSDQIADLQQAIDAFVNMEGAFKRQGRQCHAWVFPGFPPTVSFVLAVVFIRIQRAAEQNSQRFVIL